MWKNGTLSVWKNVMNTFYAKYYFLILIVFSCFSYGKEVILLPNTNSQEEIQEALILLKSGDVRVVREGSYNLEDG